MNVQPTLVNKSNVSGADPGFHLGGGGGGGGAQKSMCPHAHYERGTQLTFGRGPVPLRKLYRFCFKYSLVLSEPYFLSILIFKKLEKTATVDPILGGRLFCPPPPLGFAK